MSLLDCYFEKCQMKVHTRVADGLGGYDDAWTDGEQFDCALTLDASNETIEAEKEDAQNTYTATTRRNKTLMFHDVFKRLSDGKTFIVLSDGTDKKTPSCAMLDMRQVTVKEWELV